MRKCRFCKKEAEIFIEFPVCRDCFLNLMEKRFKRDSEKILKNFKKIAIGISGGKDSGTLLYLLKKIFPEKEIFAFHLNLGIFDFSEKSEKFAKEQAKKAGVKLHIFRLEEILGFKIPDVKKIYKNVCAVCGNIKRYLFNKIAFENNADLLLTGHHLDDFLERAINSLLSGDFSSLVRLKPFLPKNENLVARFKPFYKTLEKNIKEYAILREIPFFEEKCPFREKDVTPQKRIRKAIEILAQKEQTKYTFLKFFLELIKILEKQIPQPKLIKCKKCGFLSTSEICAFCKRVENINKLIKF